MEVTMNQPTAPSAPPAAPPRRGRFQFSLGTLVFSVLLLAAVALLVRSEVELDQLRREVRVLRLEQGRLTITDPTRIHVATVKVSEDLTWRWRVYAPQRRKCRVDVRAGMVPQFGTLGDGVPDGYRACVFWGAGEFQLDLSLRKNPSGAWCIKANNISLPFDEFCGRFTQREEMTSSPPEGVDPSKPLVLLRAFEPDRNAPNESPKEYPHQGLIVWLEAEDSE